MGTNANKFNQEVRLKSKFLAREVPLVKFHAIAFDALERLVKKTPVKTGRARGGWQVTVNEPGTGARPKSKSGNRVRAAGLTRINRAKLNDTIYITNAVHYIQALERGHSKQAPQGMLRMTLLEMQAVLK